MSEHRKVARHPQERCSWCRCAISHRHVSGESVFCTWFCAREFHRATGRLVYEASDDGFLRQVVRV